MWQNKVQHWNVLNRELISIKLTAKRKLNAIDVLAVRIGEGLTVEIRKPWIDWKGYYSVRKLRHYKALYLQLSSNEQLKPQAVKK